MDPTTDIKTAPAPRISNEAAAAWQPDAETISKLQASDTAGAIAQATPLPGPLREAFASPPRQFCGLTLQPLTATHIAALVRLKNPMPDAFRLGMAAAQTKDPEEKKSLSDRAEKMDISADQLFECLFLFTLRPAQVRKFLSLAHPVQVLASEARILMDNFAPVDQSILFTTIANHYFESFATAVQYQASGGETKKSLLPHRHRRTRLAPRPHLRHDA